MTYAPAKREVATFNSIREDAFTRKKLFDLDLRSTQNVAQYSLHHVTCAPAKFAVATSNSLGGDAFTRKYII